MRYFDLHCDTLFSIAHEGGDLRRRPSGHIDMERAAIYEPYAQVFALYCGYKPLDEPEKAHTMFEKLMSTAEEQLEKHSDIIAHCKSAQDFEQAVKNGKIAALLSIEGAELLQNDEDFETAVRQGVKLMNLAWNHDSVFACGAMSSNKKGLTERGKDLVRRMERAGITADVSHLSRKGFWELAECTDKPIVATHSNSSAVCKHRRNLTDEQFCEICRRGGLVGLNFYVPFVSRKRTISVTELFPHIDHFMELGGEKVLAIGADFDGCDRLPDEIGGVSDIARLNELMREHGYSEETIDNIFFGNAARFVKKNF